MRVVSKGFVTTTVAWPGLCEPWLVSESEPGVRGRVRRRHRRPELSPKLAPPGPPPPTEHGSVARGLGSRVRATKRASANLKAADWPPERTALIPNATSK